MGFWDEVFGVLFTPAPEPFDELRHGYRALLRGHRVGNRLLTGFVTTVFGRAFTDILSGYRVFSRRFVKSFPVLSGGFEIETELTIHALELDLPVSEIQTPHATAGRCSHAIRGQRRANSPPSTTNAMNAACRTSTASARTRGVTAA